MASQPSTSGFDLNRSTIISLLYLVGVFTALPTLIGVIMAYVWRGDAHPDWEDNHYRYHIRTFWLAVLYGVIGGITTLLGIGFLILLVIPIWMIVRAVIAVSAAQRREPVANAGSWLW